MEVKLDYIFSRNRKIGSRTISWGTGFLHPELEIVPSHVAVLINDTWVVESTLENGVRIVPYKSWKRINEEVERIPCWAVKRELDEVLGIVEELWGLSYDWAGVSYFSWRIILYILFKKEMPKENPFDHTDKFFCCEVVGRLTGENFEITSPATLMIKLQKEYAAFLKLSD